MKKLFILALLSVSSNMLAEEPALEKATSEKEYETLINYGMQLATAVSVEQVMKSVGQGVIALIVSMDQPARMKFFTAYAWAHTAALLWIRYNLPQWTDTYLLGLDTKRTRKQNMLRFIHQTILGTPGALTGEYFAQQFAAA